MKKKDVLLNGRKVAYLEAGNENDPAVFLVHGVPETSLVWKEMIPEIVSCGFRAIAPDLPGFGQSEPFEEASTWERYTEFITEFTAHMNLEDFHLIVHDWGGLIGLRWACDFPERVRSLMVSNSTISTDYVWHKLAQLWRTPLTGEKVMKQMEDFMGFHAETKKSIPNIDDETLLDFYQVFRNEDTSRVILELYRSMNKEDVQLYQGKLKAIKCPVTILWGELDPYVPLKFAFKLKIESLLHADVQVINNIGHFIQIENPYAVNKHVLLHLTRLKQ
ncbi:alpha/beta fold hydrolase [Peribacillus kribbensis]|uniref:alpha/beta fold hydrolase n=1 Tax=Peribacillus kribbensis TaxID=356658 RepID=UPI0003F62F2F|nr:alpha/beta hydrolase [Peribacillus kribbensis]